MAAPNTIELKQAMIETKPARAMNVLFINPPVPGFDKSYAKLLTFNTIPLALLYPATVLKQSGHHVAINDVKSGEALKITAEFGDRRHHDRHGALPGGDGYRSDGKTAG